MQQPAVSHPSCLPPGVLPGWVPEEMGDYLLHMVTGMSLRALARARGGHGSTVLRRVRRIEAMRDDPVADAALAALERRLAAALDGGDDVDAKGSEGMIHVSGSDLPASEAPASDDEVAREARRILRRLCERGAFLVMAPGLEKAAVLRRVAGGEPVRTAVVARRIAQAFLLKDWIAATRKGRLSIYEITHAGRAALKRMLAEAPPRRGGDDAAAALGGFAEAPDAFRAQHGDWQAVDRPAPEGGRRRLRTNLAESPLAALARRRDASGRPFLTPDLVMAGERLREDFEMAQMGPRVAQNWDRFLTGPGGSGMRPDSGLAEGPAAARERVAAALRDLGPGLGDIALRCCCYLEGLEAAEKRMGWSARSGKIVLRIALQRLKRHYEETRGTLSPLIG